MRLDNLKRRIDKLAAKNAQEIEPWWPPDDDGGLARMFYDSNVSNGIPMPVERPVETGILIYLIAAGATQLFNEHPLEDPMELKK